MASHPVFYAGQRLTAALLDQSLWDVTVKPGATSKANNTLADDPDLAGIALPVGTHEIEAQYNFQLASTPASSVAVGLKIAWTFSGTATGTRNGMGISSTNASTDTSATMMKIIGGAITTSQAYGINATFFQPVREWARVTVSVAGNLTVQWAQNVTAAGNSLTLGAGSYIKWRQVA